MDFLYKKFINKKLSRNCRVCGLDQGFAPWGQDSKTPTFDICGCCGVEFGYDDCTLAAAQASRERWLANGAKWRDSEDEPENWSLEKQLKRIPEEFR